MTVAVEIDEGALGTDTVLKDSELLEKLNGLVGSRGFRAKRSVPPTDIARVEQALERGISLARIAATESELPFRFLEVEPYAVLWPVAAGGKEQEPEEDDEDADNNGDGGPVAPPSRKAGLALVPLTEDDIASSGYTAHTMEAAALEFPHNGIL